MTKISYNENVTTHYLNFVCTVLEFPAFFSNECNLAREINIHDD